MSSIGNVSPASEGTPQPNPTAPVKADAQTTGLAATANKKTAGVDSQFGSLEELKEIAPEVYKKMMEGIANTIIKEMERREERRQKIAKEFERR